MKFLLVNLSPRKKGACGAALEYTKELIDATQHEAHIYHAQGAVAACCDCLSCKTNGRCISDAPNLLAEELSLCDAAVLATPTHYGLPVSTALSLFSRILRSSPSCVYGKPILLIATARRAGAVSAHQALSTMLSFAACPIVGSTYPTVLYGSCAEQIMRDAEGLQNIREGIRRLVWLCECIEKGKEAGINPPLPEVKIKTDISML